MAVATKNKVSGRRKAAMLLVALGPDAAADVFRALGEEEVAELSAEIAGVGQVTAGQRRGVIAEFFEMAEGWRMSAIGGASYAQSALSRSFGEDRAGEILDRLRRGEGRHPSFSEFEHVDPILVRDCLREEHPQTIAVVLANLSPGRAARVVAAFDNDLRTRALARLAHIGQMQREVLSQIQSVLKTRMAQRPEVEPRVDGARLVARILNNVDRDVEEMVLGQIQRDDPQLSDLIQRQLFLFEDVLRLEGRAIQKVLRGVDAKTLSIAMKGSTDELQAKIFENMSKRAAKVLQDELEVLGALPVEEVERAQREIIDTVRTLEREGEIVVPRGDEDEE